MDFDFDKYFNEMGKLFQKIDEAGNDDVINELIDEMVILNIETEYEYLKKGYVYDKEAIVNVLIYYLNANDYVKCNFLCYLLNFHYKGIITELFDIFIKEEKYELCAVLNRFKDTIELPSNR